MKKFFIFFICFVYLAGCAPKFEAPAYKPLELPNPEIYNIEETLKHMPQIPERVIPQYAKFSNAEKTAMEFTDDPAEADIVLLMPAEWKKVAQMEIVVKAYSDLIHLQADTINLNNKSVTQYQRLIKLLEQERNVALEAWQRSENMYREEYKQHQWDNRVNRLGMYLLAIGSLIVIGASL